MILTFFGLTFETILSKRFNIFHECHEITFHGKGYDYSTVYNMPLWLRRLTFNKLKTWYEPKNSNEDTWLEGSAVEEARNNKMIHVPDYVTKMMKK